MKTYMANNQTVERKWYVVDAEDKTLGRISTIIATYLRGKHKPIYTPHVDCGDNIIVINADKVKLTGNKWNDKMYYRHSGYSGGLKSTSAKELMEKHPTRMVEFAVKGMLPKTKLGRAMFKKLYVYAGNEHNHAAQKPEVLEVK